MSHPVFLESPPWPRMPEARIGELDQYFSSGGPSLEANSNIPLFWRALFEPEDIRYAYTIDTIDDEVALAEYLEGATQADLEAQYPYFVTEREKGLARLDSRREHLIGLVGERYRPIYDAFAAYIRDIYGPYLLVRTDGLPDVEHAGGWLRAMLEQIADLERTGKVHPHLEDEGANLRRAQNVDAVWRTTGSRFDRDGLLSWPSQALIEAFPACVKKPKVHRPKSRPEKWLSSVLEWVTADDFPADAEKSGVSQPISRKEKWLGKVLEWVGVFVFAGAVLGTWWVTNSVWIAALAVIPAVVIIAWCAVRLEHALLKSR